jgi:hypothetical protein
VSTIVGGHLGALWHDGRGGFGRTKRSVRSAFRRLRPVYPSLAEEAIGRFAQLYAVEKEARGSPPDRRTELRKAHAAPVFDDLEQWLAMQLTTISSKSPLAGAIRHALTRMERLRPYLDNCILGLGNNAADRGMGAVARYERPDPLLFRLRAGSHGYSPVLGLEPSLAISPCFLSSKSTVVLNQAEQSAVQTSHVSCSLVTRCVVTGN